MKINKLFRYLKTGYYHGGNIIGKPSAPLFITKDIRYAQQYGDKIYRVDNVSNLQKGEIKRNLFCKKYVTDIGINKVEITELTQDEIEEKVRKHTNNFGSNGAFHNIKDPDAALMQVKILLSIIITLQLITLYTIKKGRDNAKTA